MRARTAEGIKSSEDTKANASLLLRKSIVQSVKKAFQAIMPVGALCKAEVAVDNLSGEEALILTDLYLGRERKSEIIVQNHSQALSYSVL